MTRTLGFATVSLDATPFALLDLDDTLVDSAPPMRAWALDLCARYGLPESGAQRFLSARKDYPTWRAFVAEVARSFGLAAEADAWSADLLADYPRRFVLEPEVARRLGSLRAAGWRLGIVTNGETDLQSAKIHHTALVSYVDAVCISEAVGARKPDRAVFESAARALGVGLGPHGWMVGDTLDTDVVGGNGAGLRTAWLSAAACGDLPETAAETFGRARHAWPDYVCSSIVDALDMLLGAS